MIPEGFLMEAAKPVINALVKNVITPQIQSFAEKCHIKYNELLIPRGEHFEEYLHRTYKKYSIINTLVFKNEQRLLKDLYLPLTLSKGDSQSKDTEQIKIDKYPQDLIKKYNKILITDTAGMGKSTITKKLFLDVIENGYGIPIYIEMRRLSNNRSILLEIQEQINSLTRDFDVKLLLEFIKTGGFIIFLDGYDEIALDERSAVTANVQDFISKADNNTFILTSRPEQALTGFGDFQVFTINPLNKKEAYELLRKYDNQGTTSKQLIDELKSGQYEMINEFLKNPLLVSLLFAAFDYKQTIPLKKHIFYRQVYDAYFDSHDLSKGDSYIHDKKSGLDIDDFERVLRSIGFRCLKMQRIEFEKDVLLQIIGEAKEFCSDLNFTASDYFGDILSAVPLFCRDGQLYKWVHKSLQEYFAAQFIYKDAKNNQDIILSALYNSNYVDKYINLLDLYYDIDNWGFKKNILKPLCESYVNFYENSVFSSNVIPQKEIENRIGLLFMREACFLYVDPKSIHNTSIFKEIEQRTKSYLKDISSIIIFHNNDIATSDFCNLKRKLLPLLYKRRKDLFMPYSNSSESRYILPQDKTVYVTINTGENNIDEYLFLNNYLRKGNHELPYYLNYNTCKIELDNIYKITKKKEKDSDLIDGL